MEYRTIRDILTNAEKCFGNEDAIRYKTGKNEIAAKTYTQLKEDSERITALLKKLEESKCHIALIGATSYLWIASYFGIVDGGNVAVPLDVSLPAEELCELIDRADVTILILDEIRKDVIEAAKEKCPKLKYILSMQKEANEGNILSLTKSMMEQMIDEDTGVEKTEITPDQLCTIMFTSGTTGKSKGVMLTHRNLVENATCLDMKLPERNVLLSVLPIHHAYCLSMDILKGISLGAIICINDSLMRVAKNIKLFKPNMILMVPLMIETFAKKLEDVKDLPEKVVKEAVFGSQFHTICSGGAYLNPEYIELFERFGIQILQGYGMTECGPIICYEDWSRFKPGSCGKAVPRMEVKVLSSDPENIPGEIVCRGPNVMLGYYKNEEATREAIDADGWLHTGDLALMDAEGNITIKGRSKNMLLGSSGQNIYPEEIEDKLNNMPYVAESIIVQQNEKLVGLVYPDFDDAFAHGLTTADIERVMEENRATLNTMLPAYSQIFKMKIYPEEFEKTPKRSIKRFLYQEAKG